MVECERAEGWKNDKYLNVANRVFGHLAIAGEGGAGKKPAGVGGGGNESPENDITNEEGDHENCDYFFAKSEDRQRKLHLHQHQLLGRVTWSSSYLGC